MAAATARAWLASALLVCSLASAGARTQRDIAKKTAQMTEEDWRRVEEEWETPEEKEEYEFKPPKARGLDVEKLQREKDPKKRQRMVEDSQKTTGPTMIFATVDYPGCCEDKSGTEEIAKRWNALLGSKGMDAQAYVVDNATILFSTNHGLFADEIVEFALEQPECVATDWNSKRTPGPAETPEWKAKDEVRKAAKAKADAEAKAAKEAAEKAAKRAKRRRRRKKREAKQKDEV
mmetsp:Transcript_19391/g.64055  ORF Transcript_19391/g.64055 Transcript_19391/m.64055 type:complete len:234 (-) Transcript_19391:1718-2419(-)